jgi:hypothetical protein
MRKSENSESITLPDGRVAIAFWWPVTTKKWRVRTFVEGDNSTVNDTTHGGLEPRLAAIRAARRRLARMAAGGSPGERGWGGKRTRPADKQSAAVTMRAHVSVDLAARLVHEANAAGTSVAIHIGRVLQEARP